MHYLLAQPLKIEPRLPSSRPTKTAATHLDMAAVLDMIAGREVAALLVSPQTPTAATDELQVSARRQECQSPS